MRGRRAPPPAPSRVMPFDAKLVPAPDVTVHTVEPPGTTTVATVFAPGAVFWQMMPLAQVVAVQVRLGFVLEIAPAQPSNPLYLKRIVGICFSGNNTRVCPGIA